MNLYIPTTKRCTSVKLATLIIDSVIRYYSVPSSIVTDRSSVFTS